MGRPVRLDTFNRIVALMPWMQPETDYTGQYIRVHDAGFRQGRAPKGEGPPLDAWVVILMKQINTQVCQGPLAPLDGEECVVCSSAPDRKVVDDGAGYRAPTSATSRAQSAPRRRATHNRAIPSCGTAMPRATLVATVVH
eukprot:9479966-Pyramimonas_sp.AAC.1